jgi:hypothetical protein
VNPIAKQAAEIALRLAALPADALRSDKETLDEVERLAIRILTEISALRRSQEYGVGESRGLWPSMQPRRQ